VRKIKMLWSVEGTTKDRTRPARVAAAVEGVHDAVAASAGEGNVSAVEGAHNGQTMAPRAVTFQQRRGGLRQTIPLVWPAMGNRGLLARRDGNLISHHDRRCEVRRFLLRPIAPQVFCAVDKTISKGPIPPSFSSPAIALISSLGAISVYHINTNSCGTKGCIMPVTF
jgi:hypothetical protein